MFAIAREIAEERGWTADWFNDQVTQFWPDYGDPEWHTVIQRGEVAVVIAPPDLMLAMKLYAGRGRRDSEDVTALIRAIGITSISQARSVFETYYPHDELKPISARWLANLLPDETQPER